MVSFQMMSEDRHWTSFAVVPDTAETIVCGKEKKKGPDIRNDPGVHQSKLAGGTAAANAWT
ncbi:Uncharacterized protein APZ42_029327 [Daphnia magna]|uniref:Uncharacterized protein n=1 Tax=Daphnia magna TaxID=35525 RepID=A0A164PR08_9CRUS|nr:Uncharacterized protein APZ42_029327 [Daphnia magna]